MLNIFKRIISRKEPYDPKYATAVKYGYDTRCIVVDLIDTDENQDILEAALESIEQVPKLGNFWCQNYDGYLDEGDDDRLQIVISNPNASLFKMHIMSILCLLSIQTGKDIKLYQSRDNEWYNTREYYDYYGYISEMQ